MLADTPDAWQWEATVAQRSLVESDAAGARLLKESGPLARLRITARPSSVPAGRVEFSAALAHAQLDYDGRTQGGAPLATRSRHDEIEAGARWMPSSAFAWGTPAITFDALRFRRAIAATAAVGSLTETSTLWMPGVSWTSPSWTVATTSVAVDARWRASLRHDLAVDYAGLFDASSLRAGRRNELALGVTAALPRRFALSLRWSRARQAASDTVPLYRAGALVGTVHQPRIVIDDTALTLSRNF